MSPQPVIQNQCRHESRGSRPTEEEQDLCLQEEASPAFNRGRRTPTSPTRTGRGHHSPPHSTTPSSSKPKSHLTSLTWKHLLAPTLSLQPSKYRKQEEVPESHAKPSNKITEGTQPTRFTKQQHAPQQPQPYQQQSPQRHHQAKTFGGHQPAHHRYQQPSSGRPGTAAGGLTAGGWKATSLHPKPPVGTLEI